jgi:methionyl-tRNA synthetase
MNNLPVSSPSLMSPSLVVVPPPTPNGSLHVGHLSGPYLYADVYRRARARWGQRTSLPFHTDVHQSYVATAAARRGTSPAALAESATADIRQALALADIPVTVHGVVDADYVAFVRSFFDTIRSQDGFVPGSVTLPRDASGLPLFEAWVSGRCPVCLAATCGGICEVCGHPNGHADLLTRDRLDTVKVPALLLRLEQFRPGLEAHFAPVLRTMRPSLRGLLLRLFESPLPNVPVTLPGTWGCRATMFAGDHVYNPWLELLPAHLFFASRTEHPWTINDAPILFFGFDNSWYYTLVHAALLLAHGGYALPRHYVTNEFYELGDLKFSTSLGHVVWAKDALETTASDALRYYVARTNPAYQRTSFDPAQVERTVARDVIEPLRAVLDKRRDLAGAGSRNGDHDSDRDGDRFGTYFDRLEAMYEPNAMDLRGAALGLASGLPALLETVRDRSELDDALARWASLAAPLIPRTAAALERALSTAPDATDVAAALSSLSRVSS